MGSVEQLPTGKPAYTAPTPIMAEHALADFDCGKPPLNDFLRQRALKNEARASRTFVVTAEAGPDANQVVGFYSLAAGAVQIQELPKKLRRNMPNPAPVMVLGRLAVDSAHGAKGIGSGMLQDGFRRCVLAHQNIGAVAIVVHAIDDEAVTFYTQYGFQLFPTGTRTLFLPMQTVIASLE